jgi:hypothetical protein
MMASWAISRASSIVRHDPGQRGHNDLVPAFDKRFVDDGVAVFAHKTLLFESTNDGGASWDWFKNVRVAQHECWKLGRMPRRLQNARKALA